MFCCVPQCVEQRFGFDGWLRLQQSNAALDVDVGAADECADRMHVIVKNN